LFSEICEQIVLSSAPIQLRTVPGKFKFIRLGSSGVGKTSIYERLNGKEFSLNKTETIGVDFSKITRTVNGQTFEIDLWDTYGQEVFHSILPMYYRGADAAIVIYDINDRKSFDQINFWFKELEEKAGENIPVILLANKSDRKYERQVETEQEQRLLEARKNVCKFAEVSAKNDINFEFFLDHLIVKILDMKNETTQSASIGLNETGKKDIKHCC
jgi:small GTP-binding protein